MSLTFAYPTIAAPVSSRAFDDVETLPAPRPYRALQTAYETDGGQDIIFDWGTNTLRVWTLRLYPMTKTDVDWLLGYWQTVNARMLTWQLRDSFGVTYTVRFAQDLLAPTLRDGYWDCAVTVKVQ